MTTTTVIILNGLLGVLVVFTLVVFLAHAIHADRFMTRTHVRALPQNDLDRIAA
jgi:hypothetical protein